MDIITIIKKARKLGLRLGLKKMMGYEAIFSCAFRKIGEHGYTVLPHSDDFWYADPLIISREGRQIVYMERVDRHTGIGAIVASDITQGTWSDPVPVIEENFHMSFPMCFEMNGDLYMIPETEMDNAVNIYRCTGFPYEWEHAGRVLEGEKIVDSVVVDINKDSAYLIGSYYKPEDVFYTRFCSYRIIMGEDGSISGELVEDPVLQNTETESTDKQHSTVSAGFSREYTLKSRMAGYPLWEEDKVIYPVQRSTSGIYGYSVEFMLDVPDSGEMIREILPGDTDIPGYKLIGVHTYSTTDIYEVIDIQYLAKKIKNPVSVVMIGHKSIPSRQGGIEVVVDRLSSKLASRGYEVWAYNRRDKNNPDEGGADGRQKDASDSGKKQERLYNGVHLCDIPAPQKAGLNAFVYACLATIKATVRGFDIYHFHAEGPCVMLWLPALFRKKSRIIVTIHGLDWQRAKWGMFASHVIHKGEKQAVKHADEIIVLSRNVQKYFSDTYGRRTVYIPNGTDRPDILPPKLITEKYGLKGNNYILFVARIVPEKGLHYLINAFKSLDTGVKLVIAGGSGQADEYMDMIRNMANDDDRIIMTGFVEGQLLSELYSNAYLYVCPSDVEGMSLSLLEAASYGNCCLVSDIPENTEVMGDNCVTFEHGNVSDLKDKLSDLLDNEEQIVRLKKITHDYICEHHTWDIMTDQTVKIYTDQDRQR